MQAIETDRIEQRVDYNAIRLQMRDLRSGVWEQQYVAEWLQELNYRKAEKERYLRFARS